MKVRIIKTGETKEVKDAYALRLIERGEAVAAAPVKEAPKKAVKK